MIRQLQDEILALKKEKGIAILAHSYQAPEILEIADKKGDSFQLSVQAAQLSCKKVILCGVRFMADTVKILSPEKEVILPVPQATCPMAEQVSPEQVLAYKKEHPDHKIVAYINTTTPLKAVCDVCVTSSSAEKIIENIPEKNILFLPDKNLGSYIQKTAKGKNIVLWDGMCPVHDQVTEQEVIDCKKQYPDALLLVHPECPAHVVKHADYVGSTSGILDFAMKQDKDCIIGTEKSIVDTLSYQAPNRRFILLSKNLMCPNMRMTNLVDVYQALTGQGGEVIEIEEELRLKALKPIEEMIRLGK